MNIGDSFQHQKWGRGVVLDVLLKGNKVVAKVRYGFATDTTPIEEIPDGESLRLLSPKTSNVRLADHKSAHDVKDGSPPLLMARRGIQALKLGQVLEEQVGTLSVGTREIESQFSEAFDRAARFKPQLVMIEGAWGVGKTHLLTLLTSMAASRGFATASTILDGWGATVSEPMRLMEGITSSIRFPGEYLPSGIGAKLGVVKRHGMPELRSFAGQRMVKLMEEIPEHALDDPEVILTLEDYMGLSLAATQARARIRELGYGDRNLPALKARSIDERAQRFQDLLCDWTGFCVGAGAKGLLIVMDEVDVDYARSLYWNAEWRSRHDATLKAIGLLKSHRLPIVIAFGSAPAGPDDDESVDSVRDVIRKIGHLDVRVEAATLSDENLIELGERIFTLYCSAYTGFATKLDQQGRKSVCKMLLKQYKRELSPVPRRFVRSLLHCFDLIDQGQSTVEKLVQSVR